MMDKASRDAEPQDPTTAPPTGMTRRAPTDSRRAPDFVFVVDDHGRVRLGAEPPVGALGLDSEAMIGRRLTALLSPGNWALRKLSVPQAKPPRPPAGEGALQITEAELSGIFRDAPVLMLLADSDGAVRQVNRAVLRFTRHGAKSMLGRSAGEALRCLYALDKPNDCGFSLFCNTCPLQSAIDDALRHGRSRHRAELSLPLHRRGCEGDSHLLVTTIPMSASGRPMVLLCLEDITERKRAEQELHESRRTLTTLMSNLPGMAYRCRNDTCWTMEFVSEGCLQLTGYQPRELVMNRAISYEAVIHPDDRDSVRRDVGAALRARQPFELFYRIHTADGEEKWVWEQGRGVLCPDGQLVALEGFITDITARKEAEQEKERMQALLLQAQKMEAIGVLAGGVAHDFNNLLTIIQGNAELAMMAADQAPEQASLLKKVVSAAEHGARLVRQLLVFSRKHPMQVASVNINSIVRDLLKMLGRLIGEDIVIESSLAPDLWTARCDETNIEQVIMNLAVNARDAMPDGGKLTIATSNVTLDADAPATMPDAKPGTFVRLAIADTGVGMDEEVLPRIFEPFFSTKEAGRGTGLGLSVVYGIVREHGGWIAIDSQPGQGTTFEVYLPASAPAPATTTRRAAVLGELKGNGERLLLVEDEAAVRDFASRALRHNGYDVIVAANAEEAEAIVGTERGTLDLIVSDVVLPGNSGLHLVDRLRTLQPTLRVLLTSGYVDRKSQWDVIRERDLPFLAKPYSLVALLQAVRRALAATA